MVKRIVIASAAALALLMIGAPARAHHSANAEFDTQKEFTITGTLTKLENVNPHSWWYVDVKGPDGKVHVVEARIAEPGGPHSPGAEGEDRPQDRRHLQLPHLTGVEGPREQQARIHAVDHRQWQGIRRRRAVGGDREPDHTIVVRGGVRDG